MCGPREGVFSEAATELWFFVVLVDLRLPAAREGLLTLHRADRTPLVDVHFHRHAELEVNVVLAGQAHYLLEGRRCDLAAGDLVFLHPGQEHCLAEQDAHFRMWVLVFRPSLVGSLAQALGDADLAADDPVGNVLRTPGTRWARDFDRLAQAVAVSTSDAAANRGLAFLLGHAREAFVVAPIRSGRHLHPAVVQALDILRDEDDPGTLGAIAARVGLSPGRLSRRFAAEVGLPLATVRNRLRILRFIDAYGDGGERTLTEAAFSAGFQSYAQFYTMCRRILGLTPRAFARQRAQGLLGDEVLRQVEHRL